MGPQDPQSKVELLPASNSSTIRVCFDAAPGAHQEENRGFKGTSVSAGDASASARTRAGTVCSELQ